MRGDSKKTVLEPILVKVPLEKKLNSQHNVIMMSIICLCIIICSMVYFLSMRVRTNTGTSYASDFVINNDFNSYSDRKY